ncbi:hypothetical protein [Acidihalobacter prosperus]|uniref:hypothetical protein n=1 Tax=Acidihalobacter prosperus TaxID=160660 RepID=UPI0005012641|nr:hypothetical protein [Acidihalobacter prosperus]
MKNSENLILKLASYTFSIIGTYLMLAVSVSPHDAASNLAAWLHALGITRIPASLQHFSIDTWTFWFGALIATPGLLSLFSLIIKKYSSSKNSQLCIFHEPKPPYETIEPTKGHIRSTVNIGIKNTSINNLSNWSLYVDEVTPYQPLIGGLPLLIKEGHSLRYDEPETIINLAEYWDHIDKYRFSAPISGFAETLNYMDASTPRTIVIRLKAGHHEKRSTYKIWVDNTKTLHLKYLGDPQ